MESGRAKRTPLLLGTAALMAASLGSQYVPPVEHRGPWPTDVYSHCALAPGASKFRCQVSESPETRANVNAYTYTLHTAPGISPFKVNNSGCSLALSRANAAKCHRNLNVSIQERKGAYERELTDAKAKWDAAHHSVLQAYKAYVKTYGTPEKGVTYPILLENAERELAEFEKGVRKCGTFSVFCKELDVEDTQKKIETLRIIVALEKKRRDLESAYKNKVASAPRQMQVFPAKTPVNWGFLDAGFPTHEQYMELKSQDPSMPDPYEDPLGYQAYISWCSENPTLCAVFPLLVAFGLTQLSKGRNFYKTEQSVKKVLAEEGRNQEQRARVRNNLKRAQLAAKLSAKVRRRGGALKAKTYRKRKINKQTRRI